MEKAGGKLGQALKSMAVLFLAVVSKVGWVKEEVVAQFKKVKVAVVNKETRHRRHMFARQLAMGLK